MLVGVVVGVSVGVRVAVCVGVLEAVAVGVCVAVLEGVGVTVLVGVVVGVSVGVRVAVWVGVCVGVALAVAVGVGVDVGVRVAVDVGVAVGVCVGVLVGVRVGELVGVTVGVGVGAVAVGVTEAIKVQPMSLSACVASRRNGLAVANGSMSSSGVNEVSKCETEEPGCCVVGAYISTWLPTFPDVRKPLLASTFGPTQCRLPLLVLAATRWASVMFG